MFRDSPWILLVGSLLSLPQTARSQHGWTLQGMGHDWHLSSLTQAATPQDPPAAPMPSPLKLIDISLILLNDFSASTAKQSGFRSLEAGGHDPKNRGFTAANEELALSGIVDPYFRGDGFVVLSIDEGGETVVELEEAFLTTLALPYNLQFKFGQFFDGFGRHNTQHPHARAFVDAPVVSTRMFGPEGLRGPGAELSCQLPLPFLAEAILGAQNAFGETASSFGSEAGATYAGRTLLGTDVKSASDLIHLARLKTAFDLTDEVTLVPGVSALWGPNSSGVDRDTRIQGIDVYLKWKPAEAKAGFPFVALEAEAIQRQYEAGENIAAGLTRETLDDWGQYLQLIWGFERGWVAGFRHEIAHGSDNAGLDPQRDKRARISPNLTYHPSEFSKIRLQYNYDRADFLKEPEHSVILQFEVSFGVHGAHKF